MPRHDLSRPWELQLELETAQGNHIENTQSSESIPIGAVQGFEARFGREFPFVLHRTHSSTAMYNCHGLVFAARRTQIYDSTEIRKILIEDGYRKIAEEHILPGDVALYVSERGAIDHSAVVIESPSPGTRLKVPRVFSKWGNWIEVIHWANECPWAKEPGTLLEYYRLVR